jgi:peptide/nickel transport system permease protein
VTALGLVASARRGWTEEVIMRLSDFTFAFPGNSLGHHDDGGVRPRHCQFDHRDRNFQHTDLFARITRGSGQRAIGSREFVLAAQRLRQRAMAASPIEHILPNIILDPHRSGHHPVRHCDPR